jgi:uncharacterized protein (TIGR03437 family)
MIEKEFFCVKRIIGIVFILTLFFPSLYLRPAFTQTTTVTEDLATFQLTSTPTADIFISSVSDDGRRVVFESTQNLSGGNGDGNREVFMYDADLGSAFQITATENIVDTAGAVTTRVTNNTPVISGDGTRIVFTSNSGTLAGANGDGNQEVFVAIVPRGSQGVTYQRITTTTSDQNVKESFDSYSPTVNRDGSVIAFVSTRAITASNTGSNDPLDSTGARKIGNTDGNGEIYLYKSGAFFQVTSRLDADAVNGFNTLGANTSPFLSGDGKVLAFVSSYDFARSADTVKNTDFNAEIFLYREGIAANTFTQVTSTTLTNDVVNMVNASRGIFPNAIIRTERLVNVLSTNGRHLTQDGKYLVFESSGNFDTAKPNADKSREVYLYDTVTKTYTNITDQKPTLTSPPTDAELAGLDFGFRPSINPLGTAIAFGSFLNLAPVTTEPKSDNTDSNREVFTADIRSLTAIKLRQVTITTNIGAVGRELDERDITINAWPSSGASAITFTSSTDPAGNNSDKSYEVFQTIVRPVTTVNSQAATAVNAASYETPSDTTTLPIVARGSTVAIFGTQLANALVSATSADLPLELGGVNVTVAGIPARLIFVSPSQINFQMPQGVTIGTSVNFTVYNNGVLSLGKARIEDIAPGIFTASVTGTGPAAALCLDVTGTGDMAVATYSVPPCAVSTDEVQRYLVIFGTGWRNGTVGNVTVQVQKDTATAVTLTPVYAGIQPDFQLAGLDQINVQLPKDLATGTLKLSVVGGTVTTITSRSGVEIAIK